LAGGVASNPVIPKHLRFRRNPVTGLKLTRLDPLPYKLCASSGVMFIRRTTQTSNKTTVHETGRWLAKRAEEVWTLLLTGQAH
jgi:hypothetical protein